MKARFRVFSMLLALCMLITMAPIVSAAELGRVTHTIKAGQPVVLESEIVIVAQYEVSVNETHTSGGAGLNVNVIPDPDDSQFQIVVLEGQINEPGTYKYALTATYRDAFGQLMTKTQDVTVEVVKGYTDTIVKDQTNVNVNYKDSFAHGLPANVKIDPDRTHTLALYGMSASVDADNLTITGTTTKAGTAQVTVSGMDEEGITSYYTVQIAITTPDAFASTVNKTVRVGEKVNLQITHGLEGTPLMDPHMPNNLDDFDLKATSGIGMLTITGKPLKPGTAEVSFTDGNDRVTVKITINGTDMSSNISYLEILGLEAPVDGELPVTSFSIDHKALGISNVQWTYVKDGEDVKWNHTKPFDLDEKYACYVTVNAMTGYTFESNVLVYTGNNNAEDVVLDEEADALVACFYFGYPKEPVDYIEKVRIENADFPSKAGITVNDSLIELDKYVTVSGKATLDYITWSNKDDDGTLSSSAKFEGGKTYTCRFILEAPKGSEFAEDVAVTVNGGEGVKLSFRDEKLIVAYNYTVPEPKEENLKLTYSSATIDCNVGDRRTITVSHNLTGDYDVDYQWYHNTEDSTDGASALAGADTDTLTVPTFIDGVNYYFCVVSAIKDGVHYKADMNTPVRVNVKPSDYVFPFTDVPANQWYRSYVEIAHRNGLINGKSDTLYKPDDNMTLAECIKLAACMHQLHYDGEVTLENGNPWYQTYVDYAKENRIIAKETTLSDAQLKAPVTRAVYVSIFSYALPGEALVKINEVPVGSLPDVPADHPYAANIYKMYNAGIINGSDAKGTFGPNDNIKRSAVAAILVRMMDPAYRVGAPAELGQ
ncbi:MAG: S-layer homology domain-containing protein [Clostridia bacterium]|nr:S-layer homology domain-containing protein [Clostridia bacterium]